MAGARHFVEPIPVVEVVAVGATGPGRLRLVLAIEVDIGDAITPDCGGETTDQRKEAIVDRPPVGERDRVVMAVADVAVEQETSLGRSRRVEAADPWENAAVLEQRAHLAENVHGLLATEGKLRSP